MEFEKPTLRRRIKTFFMESRRVLRITKKPSMEEFKVIVKISGIGILIIGILGALIHIFYQLIR